jgi:hypothetical protein
MSATLPNPAQQVPASTVPPVPHAIDAAALSALRQRVAPGVRVLMIDNYD